MNVIAAVEGGTVFRVTGTNLAVVAVLCFVWFPRNISTWSCLVFCLFVLGFFGVIFICLKKVSFERLLTLISTFPRWRVMVVKISLHIPSELGKDWFSLYWSVVGFLDFNFVMWYILQKWILLFLIQLFTSTDMFPVCLLEEVKQENQNFKIVCHMLVAVCELDQCRGLMSYLAWFYPCPGLFLNVNMHRLRK